MLNKKGFTLVELLVTIAIMLTILGIAIISFVNLSNKKKQESYELVKDQIEEAAKQYFETNEYLFGGVIDGSTGEISLGKLVGEDYLNKVTDPRTGKPFSYCTVVKVTKNGNSYDLSLDESTIDTTETSCDSDSSVVVTEPGAPKIDLSVSGVKGNNDWYVKQDVKVIANINAEEAPLSNIGICEGIDHCENFSSVGNLNLKQEKSYGETSKKTVGYVVTNLAGKSAKAWIDFKLDKTAPTLVTKIDNSNWTNSKSVNYSSDIKDNISKIASVVQYWNATNLNESQANSNDYKWNGSYYNNKKDGTKTEDETLVKEKESYTATGKFSGEGVRKIIYKACDMAGNCTYSNEAVARIDRTKPTCGISLNYGTKGNVINGIQWYLPKQYVGVTLKNMKDDLSGLKDNTYGLSTKEKDFNKNIWAAQYETSKVTWYGNVMDNAGNVGKCSSTFAVETSVSFALNYAESAKATAVKGTGKGKPIFGTRTDGNGFETENTCSYGTCSSIRCRVDGKTCDKATFAKSCMYVGNHLSYFDINAISAGGKQTLGVATDPAKYDNGILVEVVKHNGFDGERRKCPNGASDDPYDAFKCGIPGGGGILNMTVYKFTYTTPAGLKASNSITLYTQYMTNCGYSY